MYACVSGSTSEGNTPVCRPPRPGFAPPHHATPSHSKTRAPPPTPRQRSARPPALHATLTLTTHPTTALTTALTPATATTSSPVPLPHLVPQQGGVVRLVLRPPRRQLARRPLRRSPPRRVGSAQPGGLALGCVGGRPRAVACGCVRLCVIAC